MLLNQMAIERRLKYTEYMKPIKLESPTKRRARRDNGINKKTKLKIYKIVKEQLLIVTIGEFYVYV